MLGGSWESGRAAVLRFPVFMNLVSPKYYIRNIGIHGDLLEPSVSSCLLISVIPADLLNLYTVC